MEEHLSRTFRDDLSARLFECFTASPDLSSFVRAVSEVYQNPVMVVDNTFKILAHSGEKGVDDASWLESIRHSYYSNEILSDIFFRYRKGGDNLHTTPKPFFRCYECSEYVRMISRLVSGGKPLGSVVVLCANVPTQAQEDNMPFLSELAVRYLLPGYYDGKASGQINYDSLFLDLLQGNIRTRTLLQNRLMAKRLEGGRFYQLFTLKITQSGLEEAIHLLSSKMKSALPVCWTLLTGSYYNALWIDQRPITDTGRVCAELEQLFTQFPVRICHSPVFDDLLAVHSHYQNNRAALRIADMLRNQEKIFPFERYRFASLVFTATQFQPEQIDRFTSEEIRRIRDYDLCNGSAYLDTLQAYLENNLSCTGAARALHTHKNTVLYRIRRMTELFGILLPPDSDYFPMLLSCRLLQLQAQAIQK